MNRRDFLKGMGIGAASVVVTGWGDFAEAFGANSPRKKPNIVFILADDLGWHQLGCYGSKFYETPNLDDFAKEGMRFTDAYAACPVCSPTRASIMTGKYPARLHLTDFIKGGSPTNKKLLTPDWTAYLPLEEVTIAEALKSAGYACGHFGKWHLNKDKKYQPGRPMDPGSQGFDDVLTTHKPGAGPKSKYEEDWHHVREITGRSAAFIENNKDKPFFCYVSYNSIHRPEMEKDQLVAKYANKPGADKGKEYGHNNPKQAAMLETMDKSVGTLLKTLDELNLRDNTIVIFFSDNGHLGPKDCKPLRGSKADLYEGGIRVPMIVCWPGVVKPGATCDVPVISIDFFPTLLEAVGLKVTDPTVDGVSIMALLKRTGSLKRDAIYFHYPHYHGLSIAPSGVIRQGRYKLVEWFEKSADFDGFSPAAVELYDLEKDLNEQNNLAGKMPEKAAELYAKLKSWRKCVGAQEMARNPAFKSEK
ncbi:MAG TPA: sulfatase-like hydrolase/transferase [Sedimentisphaerales bacterium]|nr:sulfatase-like hydrolase/transferase [Sedimentisphaerales bacterium]